MKKHWLLWALIGLYILITAHAWLWPHTGRLRVLGATLGAALLLACWVRSVLRRWGAAHSSDIEKGTVMDDQKKDCTTCLHRCMDMDLDPYCFAPKVTEKFPAGRVLYRGAPDICLMKGAYTLWELDTRGQDKSLPVIKVEP